MAVSFPVRFVGVSCKAYDTDELTWRHLNFFQHQTFLHAGTPRVDCSQCGIHRVAVPWARPDSGFTLLFEALVVNANLLGDLRSSTARSGSPAPVEPEAGAVPADDGIGFHEE